MLSPITEFSVCVELKDAPPQYEASGFKELFCNNIGLIEGGEIQQGMITRVDDSSEPIVVSQIVTAAMATGDTIGCKGKVNVSPVEDVSIGNPSRYYIIYEGGYCPEGEQITTVEECEEAFSEMREDIGVFPLGNQGKAYTPGSDDISFEVPPYCSLGMNKDDTTGAVLFFTSPFNKQECLFNPNNLGVGDVCFCKRSRRKLQGTPDRDLQEVSEDETGEFSITINISKSSASVLFGGASAIVAAVVVALANTL